MKENLPVFVSTLLFGDLNREHCETLKAQRMLMNVDTVKAQKIFTRAAIFSTIHNSHFLKNLSGSIQCIIASYT